MGDLGIRQSTRPIRLVSANPTHNQCLGLVGVLLQPLVDLGLGDSI